MGKRYPEPLGTRSSVLALQGQEAFESECSPLTLSSPQRTKGTLAPCRAVVSYTWEQGNNTYCVEIASSVEPTQFRK